MKSDLETYNNKPLGKSQRQEVLSRTNRKAFILSFCLPALIIILLIASVTSCSLGQSGPSVVVKNFYSALADGDMDKAQESLLPSDSVYWYTGEWTDYIDTYEIVDERVKNEQGTAEIVVEVTLVPGKEFSLWPGGRTSQWNIQLEKWDSGWKIVNFYGQTIVDD